ncbi:MAG TPA: metalloregulator ArsR/SmtB family transcription factor [Blastocatellia bacterium]|nr:metalloregulator ArsR/SmtB family transcription factor [Blastocatellia bacterium]
MVTQQMHLQQDHAFRALADPTRRAILDRLRFGEEPVTRLAGAFPVISRPAVSKHLRLLRQAGLVTEYRRGRERLYKLQPDGLRLIDQWLQNYRTFWQTNLDSLKKHVESMED